jgi:hypothetical protein
MDEKRVNCLVGGKRTSKGCFARFKKLIKMNLYIIIIAKI